MYWNRMKPCDSLSDLHRSRLLSMRLRFFFTQHGVSHQCSRAITNNTKKQQCRHKCCCSHNRCFNFRFITLVLSCFDHMVNQDLILINFLKLHIPVYKSFGTPSTIFFNVIIEVLFLSFAMLYSRRHSSFGWIQKRQFERKHFKQDIWPFFLWMNVVWAQICLRYVVLYLLSSQVSTFM